MSDSYQNNIAGELERWKDHIADIEEKAKDAATFDKLELLARAERLRTRSREIERNLELLEKVETDAEAQDIRAEIESAQSDVRDMLNDAKNEAQKRTGD